MIRQDRSSGDAAAPVSRATGKVWRTAADELLAVGAARMQPRAVEKAIERGPPVRYEQLIPAGEIGSLV
jgi:hypothetical protein